MANIGTFKQAGNEFAGEIVTLSVQAKNVRIVPQDKSGNDKAPSHRVFVALHRDLVAYGEAIALQEGGKPVEPVKLVIPMLQRFMASDRGFASIRRQGP